MKKLWRSLGVGVLALGVCTAALADDTLEKLRDEKLKAEYLKKAAWFTDFDKAREESKTSGKAIFAFFSRSYAP